MHFNQQNQQNYQLSIKMQQLSFDIHIILQLMIEEIETESNNELNVNLTRLKSVFNPYLRPQIETHPASTTLLRIEVKECRICLQSNDNRQNELVCPCNCMGSVKFIHEKCFIKWVQSKFLHIHGQERQKAINQGVQCQLCKYRVQLSFKKDYICCQGQVFCSKFKLNPFGFILFFIFFLVIFASIIILAYVAAKNGLNFNSDLPNSVIFLTAFIILGVVGLIVLFYCFSDYLVQKRWVLQGFEKKKRGRINNMQIFPQQLS